MFKSSLKSLCAISATVVLLAGCGEKGPPTGFVTGKLTIGDAPPTDQVRIIFMDSLQGHSGSTVAQEDGSYEIQDLRLGTYAVYFEKSGVVVNGDAANGEVSTDADRLMSIPPQYRTEARTPLKSIIVEGPNTFDLQVPAAKPAVKK
jgi:hypothetical protein